MERLSYEVLKKVGYEGYLLPSAPEKVMQFGEGVFLRAFTDYWFDVANEKAGWNGKCVIIKPRKGDFTVCRQLNEQEGLYTLYLRGIEKGETVDCRRVISSVSRCLNPYEESGFEEMMALAVSEDLEYIVSNTTEAGIVYDPSCALTDRPCNSFPGKLTQVLYRRYQAKKPPLVILSCELIDNNGRRLQECVNQHLEQWGLEDGFRSYVNEECLFCSTLVDRIVTGRIRSGEELERLEGANGYRDEVINVGEVFGVWNIEGPRSLEDKLPFKAAGLNCPVVPDVTPYKKRKVRILNASHTGFVPGGYLAGYKIVRECMEDERIRGYMNKMIYEEVIPTLSLDRQELLDFAGAVQDRFNNPFVDHALLSICLNSTSKWCSRILPSLLAYREQTGCLPKCLTMSFAAYLSFYAGHIESLQEQGLVCRREDGEVYTVSDEGWILEFFHAHKDDAPGDMIHSVMSNEKLWGMDLTSIPGFEKATVENYLLIQNHGPLAGFESCLA